MLKRGVTALHHPVGIREPSASRCDVRLRIAGSPDSRLAGLGESNFALDVTKPCQNGVGFSDGRSEVRNGIVAY